MSQKYWVKAFNAIFPRMCHGCDAYVVSEGLCATCWPQLVFLCPPYCALCGQPGALYGGHGSHGGHLCYRCTAEPPCYNQHRALWEYGTVSRRIIMALKHGRQRHLAPWLAQCLLPLVCQHPVDVIMPVPLHPHRLAQRGFNQAALLARALGRLTGIPVHMRSLVRASSTLSQHGFSSRQRWDNVQHAFKAFPCVASKRILLIDDVCTTGATLNACALALREQDALHVYALTVAKVVM